MPLVIARSESDEATQICALDWIASLALSAAAERREASGLSALSPAAASADAVPRHCAYRRFHFEFDDGDGFFNTASRAFTALRFSAYSLPSIGATCGGSLSRYGRPIPSSFSCASIHFHKISLHVHLSARVSPFTLTRSAARP